MNSELEFLRAMHSYTINNNNEYSRTIIKIVVKKGDKVIATSVDTRALTVDQRFDTCVKNIQRRLADEKPVRANAAIKTNKSKRIRNDLCRMLKKI